MVELTTTGSLSTFQAGTSSWYHSGRDVEYVHRSYSTQHIITYIIYYLAWIRSPQGVPVPTCECLRCCAMSRWFFPSRFFPGPHGVSSLLCDVLTIFSSAFFPWSAWWLHGCMCLTCASDCVCSAIERCPDDFFLRVFSWPACSPRCCMCPLHVLRTASFGDTVAIFYRTLFHLGCMFATWI